MATLMLAMTAAGSALADVAPPPAPDAAAAVPALPAHAAALALNSGDTAWMLTSTALVLLMTVPGLALFYAGMVRKKNILATAAQSFAITAMVTVLWAVLGYSLAFTNGGESNAFIGGTDRILLTGMGNEVAHALAASIPESVFMTFQMTFAIITPALITGAFADRMKFSAMMVFMAAWVLLVYAPVAHWVWGGGFLGGWGVLDFAGGTVVHLNAGIAGLVCAIVLGKRIGYGHENMSPHNLLYALIGASLLWVGWMGFNAGSNLESNVVTSLAVMNTFTATAGAGVAWMFAEWLTKGRPSLLGLVSGVVAGLVAVTPASGFAGPVGAMVLGIVAGVACYIFVAYVKNAFRLDDTLDVFGIHGVGGIIGALATGILVNPALGGAGVPDYLSIPGTLQVAPYDFGFMVMAQLKAVLFTIVFVGIGSLILYKIVDWTIGLRVREEEEREGLDIATHGERAYNM